MKLSALVLTKNEEEMIEGCLKQLNFVDEIIVLDNNSNDKTTKIAKKYANKIIISSNDNFDYNRNLLVQEAKGDWLLFLDCDERLSGENIQEIKSALDNTKYSAYYFPRRNFILGKWLRHGGWWPDFVPRLFRKKDFISWKGEVHESPLLKGQINYMKYPLTHNTARSVGAMLEKTAKWAQTEAKLRYIAGQRKVTIASIVKAMAREFISRYFTKFGALDGNIGLVQSLFQSLHQAIVLVYLWELQNNQKPE